MAPLLFTVLTHLLHYGVLAGYYLDKARMMVWALWTTCWAPELGELAPSARYFLGHSSVDVNSVSVVPEGAIYLEDWIQGTTKRCVIRYAGEAIPQAWTQSPYAKHPRTPWIWVGDRETEIDLTRTFAKYLVVGNRITPDLVESLIRVTPRTRLIYIETRTFKELDFPGEGLTIEEYGTDGSIQDRGSVHYAEEAVHAPVVGECNGSDE